MNWNKINTIDQLDNIATESNDETIVLFKHSTTCSISATALDRFERNAAKMDLPSNMKFYYLDLLNHRDISKAIADKFEVQHESPQVIVLKNGKAVYNESHYGINIAQVVAAN